jgi:hypothetical protein
VPPLSASPSAVIAALAWTHREPVSGGWSSAQTGAGSTSLKDVEAFALSLSVVPMNEFDGDGSQILVEIDPFSS